LKQESGQFDTLLVGVQKANNAQISTVTAVWVQFGTGMLKYILADDGNPAHCHLVSAEQTLLKYQLRLQYGIILEWESLKYSGSCWQVGTLSISCSVGFFDLE
jgi:hypothetical protein